MSLTCWSDNPIEDCVVLFVLQFNVMAMSLCYPMLLCSTPVLPLYIWLRGNLTPRPLFLSQRLFTDLKVSYIYFWSCTGTVIGNMLSLYLWNMMHCTSDCIIWLPYSKTWQCFVCLLRDQVILHCWHRWMCLQVGSLWGFMFVSLYWWQVSSRKCNYSWIYASWSRCSPSRCHFYFTISFIVQRRISFDWLSFSANATKDMCYTLSESANLFTFFLSLCDRKQVCNGNVFVKANTITLGSNVFHVVFTINNLTELVLLNAFWEM